MHWCKEAGEGPIVKGNRRRAASNRSGPAFFKQQAVKLRNLSGKAGRDFFSNRCKTITLQTPLAAQQMVCLYERQTLRKSEDVLKKGKAGKKAALARMKTCLTACLKTNWIVKKTAKFHLFTLQKRSNLGRLTKCAAEWAHPKKCPKILRACAECNELSLIQRRFVII